MPIGTTVRKLFGSKERFVAETYRRMFLNLDHLATVLRSWKPNASNILEVGCGEGAITERLVSIYPTAFITSIDISPNPGRLYSGPQNRVVFLKETVESVSVRCPAQFDLVVLCDVIHHVPLEARNSLLNSIRTTLSVHASFVLKDWTRTLSLIHALAFSSDRFLTGDEVSFLTSDELRSLVSSIFGVDSIRAATTIRPWDNNLALLISS